jgi:transcription elongation GreA/GreB family factor
VSRAFTKEDDNASFETPASSSMRVSQPFHLTEAGAARLRASRDPRLGEALALAEIIPPIAKPERAALGVIVHVRDERDQTHVYRLVSATEHALLGEGCSVDGPIGRALLGAEVGDVREVKLPRGLTELEVVALG